MKTDSAAVLQSLSLSLSLTPSAENIPVSPLVLHPSLFRRHFNSARQLRSPSPTYKGLVCLLSQTNDHQQTRQLFCGLCDRSYLEYVTPHDSDLPRSHWVPQYWAFIPSKGTFLLMQVAITASKSVWGMRLAHVGMLFNRLSDRSTLRLATKPLCKPIWPGGKGSGIEVVFWPLKELLITSLGLQLMHIIICVFVCLIGLLVSS